MRELEELSKKKIFTKVIIRVQFPDRIVLQANFHPNEMVQSIGTEVRKHLREEFKENEFTLFIR